MKKMLFTNNWLYKYVLLIILLLAGFVTVGYAASVPNVFTSGTVAKSSEVNENFNYLADRAWELNGNDIYYNKGYVGIGTASPQARLHVEDAIAWGDSDRVIQLTDSTAIGGFLSLADGSKIAGEFIPLIYGKGVGSAEPYRFGLHLMGEPGKDSSNNAAVVIQGRLNGDALINSPILRVTNFAKELMRVAASGNVGIGTNDPGDWKLNVNGCSIFTPGGGGGDIRLCTPSDGTGITIAGTNRADMRFNGSTLSLVVTNGDVIPPSTNGIVIDTLGNVGIGTESPAGKLDVNGSIYQRGSQLHADYVFEKEYTLESIEEHSKYMWENKHLKAIPKAKEDQSGQEIVEVGAHRKGIVEELEKAHIYIEQLHKRINEMEGLKVKNETLVSELLIRIEALENNK